MEENWRNAPCREERCHARPLVKAHRGSIREQDPEVVKPKSPFSMAKNLGLPLAKNEALTVDEVKRLRAAMPPDDRNWFQRYVGDPPAHRSGSAQ